MTTPAKRPIQIIQGGMWGSEAKGAIAAYLCLRDNVNFAVRTGATNAGHTVVFGGRRIAMQQLPVGWVNPDTTLVLGAGALIDLSILARECTLVSQLTGRDIRERLVIDPRAYVHRDVHHERSAQSDRHYRMGATGKGCSEALVDRVRLRGREDWTMGNTQHEFRSLLLDTENLLNNEWDKGALIQLEGTQGQLLDLYLGPYPHVTHKQTGPAQWMLEAGLSPALPTHIVMVIRTYPIRVAGNSGPMPMEISWPILAREINHKRDRFGLDPIVSEDAIAAFEAAVRDVAVAWRQSGEGQFPLDSDGLDLHEWDADRRNFYIYTISELHKAALARLDEATIEQLAHLFELTTVTRKLRRVGRLDLYGALATAGRQVRPHEIAVTFLNYEFPERWYSSEPLTGREWSYINEIALYGRAPVTLINRGPDPDHIVEV